MQTLLLIEDDLSFGYVLKEYLSLKSYELHWAKSGAEGKKRLNEHRYSLCILDLMLPDTDGFEVASFLKLKYPDLPFIFLSARSMKIDKLKGYQLGCDDYITKPIDEELLVLKIAAILKRVQQEKPAIKTNYKLGKFLFEPINQRLILEKEIINLSNKENDLLLILVQKTGMLVERKLILQQIWGNTDEFSRKSMDVFISRLRKILKADSILKIKNVHGKGFIFEIENP